MQCLEEALTAVCETSSGRCLWHKSRQCGGMDGAVDRGDRSALSSTSKPTGAQEALHQCRLIQNLVDISISSLLSLRTRCAASNDFTRREIRTLEVRLRSRGDPGFYQLFIQSFASLKAREWLYCIRDLKTCYAMLSPRFRDIEKVVHFAASFYFIFLNYPLILYFNMTIITMKGRGGWGGALEFKVGQSHRS